MCLFTLDCLWFRYRPSNVKVAQAHMGSRMFGAQDPGKERHGETGKLQRPSKSRLSPDQKHSRATSVLVFRLVNFVESVRYINHFLLQV